MFLIAFCVISVTLGTKIPLSYAQSTIMSADDRAATVSALKKVKAGKWTEAEREIAATRNPLAAKIYYWMLYTHKDDSASFDRISSFIRQNKDWPSQSDMRLTAEKQLLKQVENGHKPSNARILDWFEEFAPMTQPAMILYLDTLRAQGQTAKMHGALNHWWRNTLLSTGEQSEILDKYRREIDERSHVIRMGYLLTRKHYTNARTIASILGKGYPQLAEARIALAENKNGVDALINRVPPHLKGDSGLLFERLQWRRKNNLNIGAMEILFSPPPQDKLTNAAGWWRERHIMARRLIEEKKYDTAYSLVSQHQQKTGLPFAQAEFLAGFLALEFTKQPWRAFEHFEALFYGVKTPISKARGAYWTARASEALGSRKTAEAWYKVAAQYTTTYYGQLALETMKMQGRLIDYKLPERNLSAEAAFHASEKVQIIKLLHAAGFRKETTLFLYALSDELNKPAEYIYLAELAADLGHYHNGVHIGKKGQQKGFLLLDYAYPTLLNEVRAVDTEWALVHGLMRQESSFDVQAQSHAGARGLMQLMPATARETAKKIGVPHRLEWLTQRPSHNIRLGSAYLNQMLARYDGSYPMALAAYNGGPGRVDRWIKEIGDPRKGEISYESWVELIPIYETRNYVQRVLEAVYVYRIKFNGMQQKHFQPLYLAFNEPARFGDKPD